MLRPLVWVEPLFLPPFWPIGAICVAIMAALLVYNVVTFVRLVVPALRQIPVIGGWLASHVDAVAVAVQQAVHDWVEGQLTPVIQTVAHVNNRLRRFARANTVAHDQALAAIRRVRYDALPAAIQSLITFTQQRIAAVISLLQATAGQLRQDLQLVAQALQAYTDLRVNQAVALTLAVRDQLLEQDRREAAFAEQLVGQAITRADLEVERAARAAQAEDAAIIDYTRQLGGALAQYSQGLNLRTQQYAQQLSVQDQRYTEQVAGALQLAIGGLGAFLGGKITAIEQSDCQRQCEELGKIATQTKALDLVLLLAAAALMISHPVEAAGVTSTVLGPVVDEATGITVKILEAV